MTWRDVDPTTHPFDSDQAPDVVREVVSSPDPKSGRPRGLWSTNSIARGLAEHYGSWAFGWYNAVDECPDSGAIIRNLPASGLGSGELEQQAQRYTSALLQWRAWLEELASLFAQFAPGPDMGDEETRRLRERAVAPLVTLVVERTGAGETWRGACAQTLTWYLESTGIPPAEAEELADEVVDSEFESWVAPDAEVVGRAGQVIGGHGA
ncbi:hypothetical protein ROS62_02525 [Streptomyces sp. DSM 41972]|uniref:Uncharacterized protein n=1 Tax=Streptomyces althioticus subsp. attaecolombicae TaxID=3075534 RepID=A0ABU3HT16_9ACTN|nr:hypothetical protein [Streptomyces sp. DSM 41972]SCD40089.1 hypothetical protein GA0115238_107227 [Streptomyces sp. di50b]SCE47243.1 hypothetical protein GA0115245_143625 [Streptomyces sp. di188]